MPGEGGGGTEGTARGYRYGFNGKENDGEVKGAGNQQDYGFRIYDPRVGKFLSVDPLTKSYPELTPYQFASNRPIDGIDQDGLEFVKTIPYFPNSGNRTFMDYINEANNAGIDVLNLIPNLWNSGVSTVQNLSNHTYTEKLSGELKGVALGIGKIAKQTWQSPVSTLTSPEALRFGLNAYLTGKVSSSVSGSGGSSLPKLEGVGSKSLTPLQKITLKETELSVDGRLKGYIFNGVAEVDGVPVQLNGTYDFVAADGILSFGSRHTHLSMGAKEVEAAGALTFKRGVLTIVDNTSGHYFPTMQEAANYLRVLEKYGVNVDRATLELWGIGGRWGTFTKLKQIAPNAKDRALYVPPKK